MTEKERFSLSNADFLGHLLNDAFLMGTAQQQQDLLEWGFGGGLWKLEMSRVPGTYTRTISCNGRIPERENIRPMF